MFCIFFVRTHAKIGIKIFEIDFAIDLLTPSQARGGRAK